ncbi:SSD domain-containing protein, partial [Haematococcus lacustris]
EFIQALRAVRRLVSRLQEQLGLRVYAFSVFHVFFEQYLDVWHDAGLLLGSPLAAIGLVCWALTGSIQLNAVSLVNLAMALGIAVEFCAHVLHAFTTAPGSRPQRMAAALEKCGASVLSGITFTKLVGVAVLAAARTQIFRVYYFRLGLA